MLTFIVIASALLFSVFGWVGVVMAAVLVLFLPD